tara:strand:+ start:112 stop:852 length:741 start_codon:yes stop_codon:yes gene_type:complete
LPILFSPLGIVIFLLILLFLKKSRKYLFSALTILITFSNGFTALLLWKFIEYPWKRYDFNYLKNADAIVVLSSSRHIPPGKSNIIEWNDPDRFFAGIEIYRAGKAKRLMFTGGTNPFLKDVPPEGEIYISESISMGIPASDLSTTGPVVNTYQEAKAIKQQLDNMLTKNQKKIILVTSAFHMNRSKQIFEKQGIIVQPYPVDFKTSRRGLKFNLKNPLFWIPSSQNLNRSTSAIREIIGRIYYYYR